MHKFYCALFVAGLISSSAASASASPRILIGVSNVADMGDAEKHQAGNNLWEVAPAYHVFVMHGFEVDFVSPQGGSVPFSMDEDEVDPPGMVSYTIKHEGFREKSNDTLKPEDVDSSRYSGYFVAGGHGPLFDLATNDDVVIIASEIYAGGGVIGGCGHGPGSLANIQLAPDAFVVSGKQVTGFPNSSEETSRWTKGGLLLPFRVEDVLRERGGVFQTKDDLAHKFDVVVDERVVTAMFMASCANAAKEMVTLILR